MKRIALGTIAYTAGTFVLAIVWHIVLFEDRYRSFGYIEDEPSFLLGFTTILIQGLVLSALFPLVGLAGSGVVRGLKFSLLVGVFFWTSHVLAFIAKQTVADVAMFVVMETFYLGLQFGLFGILIGLIHSRRD